MADAFIRRGILDQEETIVISANQTGVASIFIQEHLAQANSDCRKVPVIFVGYSRGGGTAQDMAHSPYIAQLVSSIDLVVTIAPVPAFHMGSVSSQKSPIVKRHINFISEQANAAWKDIWPDWPDPILGFPEINIDGANENVLIPRTSHFTVVDEATRLYKREICEWSPSPDINCPAAGGGRIWHWVADRQLNSSTVWNKVETGIREVINKNDTSSI